MTDNFQSDASRSSTKKMSDAASDVARSVADMARDTGAQAKEAMLETASTAKDHIKDILDRQLEAGVSAAGQLAKSVRVAATDLEQHSPLMAGLVGAVATKIDGYAEEMQDRTVDHLVYTASDLTRRQPALVFGLAALAGFFVYRAVKSAPPVEAPSIQPSASGE